VDKDGSFLASLTLWSDLFQINDKLLWIVLGVSEEFGRVQSENVVGDSLGTFVEAVASVFGVAVDRKALTRTRWKDRGVHRTSLLLQRQDLRA
jgi:hypothetical protein